MRSIFRLAAAAAAHKRSMSQSNLNALVQAADELDSADLDRLLNLLYESARLAARHDRALASELELAIASCAGALAA